MMSQEDLFKKYFNLFLLENSDKMLQRSLKVANFDENCYLLMQAYTLCEYEKEDVYFIPQKVADKISGIFDEISKYDYSISKPSDFYINEYSTDLIKKFEFIRNIPPNYQLTFTKYQKQLYQYYWRNIPPHKKSFFDKKSEVYKLISGESYSEFLLFFLGDSYTAKKTKNKFSIEKRISDNTMFFINIHTKQIDYEIKKHARLPPFPTFIRTGMHVDSHEFEFNCITHPVIDSLSFHDGTYQKSASSELKWLFILCDISAYYINMCFDFYEESLLEYIKKYS